MNKTKLITGIIIIASAAGYILYLAGSDAFVYYYSVDELFQNNRIKQMKQSAQPVRIAGKTGAIKHHTRNNTNYIEFNLVGDKHKLGVIYKKRLPDNFEKDRDVVVQGSEFINENFIAEKIITRCESKYKAKIEKKE